MFDEMHAKVHWESMIIEFEHAKANIAPKLTRTSFYAI